MPTELQDADAMRADDLLADNVAGTRRRLIDRLRQHPDDQRARMFLFQLLCVDGEWAKAKAQLGALAQLSPEARMLEVVYGRAIDAEEHRDAACRGLQAATVFQPQPEWVQDIANAFSAGVEDARELRTRAFDMCPDTPGDVDGRPFDYLFDGDGRFGPVFEAIVAGRWGLIPFSIVEEITTEGHVDLRDLVWLPVQIRFREGASAGALLPARYPGTGQAADAELRLGRRTEWRDAESTVIGLGQRVWTTSDGEDVSIQSFRRIRFAPPAP